METAGERRDYGDIEPALTRELWLELREGPNRIGFPDLGGPSEHAQFVALANDFLPDAERRKFGWDYVDKLRDIAVRLVNIRTADADAQLRNSADGLALGKLADILASYLPPRDLTHG